MTKKELSQLYYLNREIEQEKQRLQELQEAATNTAARISGLPHAGGLSNKTELAAEIADSKSIIEAKSQCTIAEYNRLNRYIASVKDSLVRQIMQLRFVDGMSWDAVTAHIGGGNSVSACRMAVERYLETH